MSNPQKKENTCYTKEYSSRIKDILFELDDYQFFHSPYSQDKPSDWFIGRNKVLHRLKMILKKTVTMSGAYLVTGFRGMGKTSLVRKAIEETNKENAKNNSRKTIRNSHKNFWFIPGMLILLIFSILSITCLIIWRDNIIQYDWFEYISLDPKNIKYVFYGKSILLLGTTYLFLTWVIAVSVFIYRRFRNTTPLYSQIEISLSQDQVTQLDILRQITGQLGQAWEEGRYDWYSSSIKIIRPGVRILQMLYSLISSTSESISYRNIRRKLSLLNLRLAAEISSDSNSSLISSIPIAGLFKINTPLSKLIQQNLVNYPIANAKEIELTLISILKDIESLREDRKKTHNNKGGWLIPQIIFVIDELDKVEPNYNYSVVEDEVVPEESSLNRGLEKTRKRQEVIAHLLADLKNFLNVARAKFIFIGGREMYDASLADIADRDSFYSSIFHDVIYVNSFFKDKLESRAGVTHMTEALLCKVLLPNDYIDKKLKEDKLPINQKHKYYNLIKYRDFLIKRSLGLTSSPSKKEEANLIYLDKVDQFKISKIIFFLQNLVIYLTYRSNGTPKKLIGLIEDYIVTGHKKLIEKEEEHLFVNHSNLSKDIESKIFLRFNFNSQYEIGLTSTLYRPYLTIHSRYIKLLGDKLLFSNAFIMDHLLKFHPFGFSWRNLELIPEIILVNKEPNLRSFIEEIMDYLANICIRNTISGLDQFKFYNKIANELKFLSKISDLSSAAFNFTLDESLLIKRHYKQKLSAIRQQYRHFEPEKNENRFIHSAGFIQTNIGDLHFYDKEFDDALVYYTDSIQHLRTSNSNTNITKHQLILLIRNRLKIGLTLEKMRAYDSAFSTYRSLILDIPHLFDKIIDTQGNKDQPVSMVGIKPLRSMQLLSKAYIAFLGLIEKQRFDGITYANLVKNREEFFLLFKNVDQVSGLSLVDNRRITLLKADYFNNVGSILFYKNRNYLNSYVNEKGDDLIKHTSIDWDFIHKIATKKKDYYYLPSITAFIYYTTALRLMPKQEGHDFAPYSNQYHKAVKLLSLDQTHLSDSHILFYFGNLFSKIGDTILTFVKREENDPLEYKGQNLESDGKQETDRPKYVFSKKVIELYNIDESKSEKDFNGLFDIQEKLETFFNPGFNISGSTINLKTVLFFYRVSGMFYLKAGKNYSYTFHYKKFLYVFRDYLNYINNYYISVRKDDISAFIATNLFYISPDQQQEINPEPITLEELDKHLQDNIINPLENIATKVIRALTWTFNAANRPQIIKYRNIFDVHEEEMKKEEKKDYERIRALIYNNSSAGAEIREVLCLVEEIKLKINHLKTYVKFKENKTHKDDINSASVNKDPSQTEKPIHPPSKNSTPFNFLVNPYSVITNRFARMLELKYKCEINYSIVKNKMGLVNIFKKQEKTKMPSLDSLSDVEKINLKILINDSIFCLHEVLRTMDIFGKNYMTSYSYRATINYKLARWCQAFDNYKHALPGNTIKEELTQVLGTDTSHKLEPNYQYELAIQNLYAAIQMHKEGKTYKSISNKMFFLEDDYNDNLYHFCAALERYKINTGLLEVKIKELKEKLQETRLTMYTSYFQE